MFHFITLHRNILGFHDLTILESEKNDEIFSFWFINHKIILSRENIAIRRIKEH